MDVSDSDNELDVEDRGPPPPSGEDPHTMLGDETTAYLQALAKDLKTMPTMLV